MQAYLLNILDLFFTLYALQRGCTELNPLLQSILIMVAYKVIIVGAACWWLSKRPERIARVGLNLCTAVYAATCVYHFYYLFLIGGF